MIAKTPSPPYYAVIFTSIRTEGDNGYGEMAKKMFELACGQEGFLGTESAREDTGITVSYWKDLAPIEKRRKNSEHILAKERGRRDWYSAYKVRIARVDTEYGK